MITRRGIIQGLVGLVAAPAVIRVADLMPVKPIQAGWVLDPNMDAIVDITTGYRMTRLQFEQNLYGDGLPDILMGLDFKKLKISWGNYD